MLFSYGVRTVARYLISFCVALFHLITILLLHTDIAKLKKSLETDHRGVMVHASTLGALEALLQFLREECKPPIPVSHVNIGEYMYMCDCGVLVLC